MTRRKRGHLFVGVGTAGRNVILRMQAQTPARARYLVIDKVGGIDIAFPGQVAYLGFQSRVLELAPELIKRFEALHAVTLLAGLGGRTATDALPEIAGEAVVAGCVVRISVTTPFAFEGRRRRERAADALRKLDALGVPLQIIDNAKELRMLPGDTPLSELLDHLNNLQMAFVRGSPLPVTEGSSRG